MTVNLDPAIQQRLRVRGIPGAGRKCVGLSLSALLQELSYQAGPEPGWGSQGLQITGLQLLPFLLHRGRDAFWSIRRRLPNSFFPKAHLSELLPQQPLNPPLRGRKMLLFQVLGESAFDLGYSFRFSFSVEAWFVGKGLRRENKITQKIIGGDDVAQMCRAVGVWDRQD